MERRRTDRSALGRAGLVLAALVVAALVLPAAADACAVCFGGEESDWTTGFVLGTIMMLALPPAIVIGAVVAIYRSIKRHEAALASPEESRSRL